MQFSFPYGYDSPAGYRGRLPDGRWMLFATHAEYMEYLGNLTKDR